MYHTDNPNFFNRKLETENRIRHFTILHTESSLGWGGQEHRILAEAKIMRNRGHRILIACDPSAELHRRAKREGTGARGLTGILHRVLLEDMFQLPGSYTGELMMDGAYVREKLG